MKEKRSNKTYYTSVWSGNHALTNYNEVLHDKIAHRTHANKGHGFYSKIIFSVRNNAAILSNFIYFLVYVIAHK